MYLSSMPFRASLALFLVCTAVDAAAQSSLHLIPIPHEVTPKGDQAISGGVEIVCNGCDAEDNFAASDLRATLAERGISTSGSGLKVVLQRLGRGQERSFTADMQAEGYTITSAPGTLTLTGATAAGVFYAAQTAKQLVEVDAAGRATLHAADIRDWPSLRYRGLSDDLSRGPVDTLAFQKKLVRTLAAYKENVYSPYFEHTQQYASNPLSAPPGGAISAADARELVAYARQFHITVIPDQEAFGHLRHTLAYEQYADVAETPHGAVLAPGQPRSLEIIKAEFGELAQLYPGPFLHIGADETVDLGVGRTKAAVDAEGLAPVYLDFVEKIDTTLRPLGRKLLFWGDVAQDAPPLLKTVPPAFKKDTIAVAWWYDPRKQGYAKYITPFTEAGFDLWVAPGINNWSRMYPNWNYAFDNIQHFTREGRAAGATGQLNTIWYDDGEALASNNWFGILYGAASAWQGGEGSTADFQASFGSVFHGDATGKLNQAEAEIMAAHDLLKNEAKVGDGSDGLFWMDPWSKDGETTAVKLRPYLRDLRLHAEKALQLIAEARAAYPGAAKRAPESQDTSSTHEYTFLPTTLRETDAINALELGARRLDFTGLKFQVADEMAASYARAQIDAASPDKKTRLMVSRELSDIRGVNGRLEDVTDGYSLIRDLYEQLWLRTNRAYGLRPVLEHYDYTVGLWWTRIDQARSAQRQWENTKTLPPAAQLGIPSPTQPSPSPAAAPQ